MTAHPQGSTMVSTLTLLTTIPGVGLLGDTNDTNALDTPPGIGTSNSGHTYRYTFKSKVSNNPGSLVVASTV